MGEIITVSGKLYKIIMLIAISMGAIFLGLSYSTMYKQDHAVPILEYHDITQAPPDPAKPYTIPVSNFNLQMTYLGQHCNVVPLRTLLDDMSRGRAIPDHTVAITFDDGYKSNFTLVFPILQQNHLPATVFVVGRYTDQGTGYPALDWDNLRAMAESGLVDVGSHTYDLHQQLPKGKDKLEPSVLSHLKSNGNAETKAEHEQRIESDLRKSSQLIESHLGSRADMLSWPYSASNREDITAARQAGFTYIVSGIGYCNPHSSLSEIPRLAVPATMFLDDFIRLVDPPKVNYFQAMGLELQVIRGHFVRKP